MIDSSYTDVYKTNKDAINKEQRESGSSSDLTMDFQACKETYTKPYVLMIPFYSY